MKYIIEIYDRATKEIIDTKHVTNLKGFMLYWSSQCDNTTYGYRVKAA